MIHISVITLILASSIGLKVIIKFSQYRDRLFSSVLVWIIGYYTFWKFKYLWSTGVNLLWKKKKREREKKSDYKKKRKTKSDSIKEKRETIKRERVARAVGSTLLVVSSRNLQIRLRGPDAWLTLEVPRKWLWIGSNTTRTKREKGSLGHWKYETQYYQPVLSVHVLGRQQ